MTMTDAPVPEDWLADLTDAEQAEFVEPTDNGLTEEDAALEQPLPPTTKKDG